MRKLVITSVGIAAMTLMAPCAFAQERGGNLPAGGANAPRAGEAPQGGNAAGAGSYTAEKSDPGPGSSRLPDAGQRGAAPGKSAETTGEKPMGHKKADTMGDKQRPGGSTAEKKSSEKQPSKESANQDGKGAGSADKGTSSGESGLEQQGADKTNSGAGENLAKSDKGSSVNLSGEQRTRVQSAFKSHKGSARVNVNVDVRVGTILPHSVALVAIPSDVIVVVPEWRRYKYIVVGDTICIVDPDTFAIIDIIVVA